MARKPSKAYRKQAAGLSDPKGRAMLERHYAQAARQPSGTLIATETGVGFKPHAARKEQDNG
jgi:hypothetical protein